MLILTRKVSEALIIGDGPNRIKITFVASNGRQVRLGIDAPRGMPIVREELIRRDEPGKDVTEPLSSPGR